MDLEALLNELEDYIRSDYTVNNELWKHPGYYYGVQAMKAFWSSIRMLVYRGRVLDVRYSRFFFEHKELMQKRLVFLHEKGYIKDYSKEYSTVVEKAKTIHLMFLKYNYTRRQEIVESIIQKLNEVNQLDEEVLLNVYYELKTQITIEKKTRYQNG